MRKLISLNTDQLSLLQRLMDENHQTNTSAFIVQLLNEKDKGISVNIKRSVGRPKGSQNNDDLDDDNEEKYQYPDYPRTRSAASYNILVDWYATEGKPMPPRESLTLHPEWVKLHPDSN